MTNSSIRLIVLDVDGVMTDGRIRIDDNGIQSRSFNMQDGLGVKMWRSVGRQAAILSAKQSATTDLRARMLGIELVEQGADDKLPGLERLMERAGVTAEETCYLGDDLLDAAAMRRIGYPIAPANAVDDIKAIASHVTDRPGGHGAVRDAIEHLLRREQLWEAAVKAIGADR